MNMSKYESFKNMAYNMRYKISTKIVHNPKHKSYKNHNYFYKYANDMFQNLTNPKKQIPKPLPNRTMDIKLARHAG